MENIQNLLLGFQSILNFNNIMMTFIGGILGIIVGAMPGIGAAAGVALLLPMTFKMNPTTAIIMLAGIYYGNMFGGAYSATLLNIPGDSSAMCTALDGNPLAKKGKAGKALATGNISSFIGGAIGIVFLTVAGPALAEIGLHFGPAESASLIFFALTSIGWILGDNPLPGLIATGLGLILATIGADNATGQIRFAFGNYNLYSGISFIPLIIGMFGFCQIIEMATAKEEPDVSKVRKISLKESMLTKDEFKSILPVTIRSGIIGNLVGFLPGAGGTTAGFICYVLEKKIGKRGKNLGQGEITGVAASEAANNAAAVGSFVPLLSLGIPGSSTSAVLLGGLLMWGLHPGPLLFENNPEFVWGLIASMYLGNIVCFIVGMLIIPALVSILKVSSKTLIPIITVICVIGSYSVNNNLFDIGVMLFSGLIAFYMKKYGFSVAPLLLSFVLSPTLELQMRLALGISQGNAAIFITRPISCCILLLTVLMLVSPLIKKLLINKKEKKRT